jgi:hypothetical protein
MGRKKETRPGAPDPFQYLEVNAELATEDDVRQALSLFIKSFVVKSKQERAGVFLLNSKKRELGIREVWQWLDSSKTEALEGSAGFPQHLATRLGPLRGVYVDAEQCALVTAPEAAVLGQDCAIFVTRDGSIALVFAEIGPPTLCENSG